MMTELAHVPLAVLEAIERGAAVPLADRSGWAVMTEVTKAPCCGQMRAFFTLRQAMPTLETVVECWACTQLEEPWRSNPSR